MAGVACRDAPAEAPPGSADPPRSALDEYRAANELLILPVAAGEVVMADRPVPVSLLEPTCIVPIIQGIGRYADVGWVTPRFFIVRMNERDPGYRFQPLAGGRERFIARFRAPRSEQEAIALNGPDEIPSDAEGLFCNVSATLAQVAKRTSVRRLAIFPIDKLQAAIQVRGERRMMAVQPEADWPTGREVTVSLDLSREEAAGLRGDLQSILGHQVDFYASSQWRKTACVQRVDLSDVPAIDAYGLQDGESGAVALSSVKAAVRRLVSRDTQVRIEGECGGAMLGTEPRPGDEAQTLSCKRLGDSLQCLYEGGFSDHPATVGTHANIAALQRSQGFRDASSKLHPDLSEH